MGKDDARKLDHKTLEALRMRGAPVQIPAGRVGCRTSLGGLENRRYWLAGALSARRLGGVEGQAVNSLAIVTP